MDESSAKLVPLYRCKECGVRLFERDAKGHLERHGLAGINGNWREYFVRGRKDTPERPGASYRPLYKRSNYSKKQK